MAEPQPAAKTEDAVFRIFINADIQRVWRELTKTGEAQGAVFNSWMHTDGAGLAAGGVIQMRTETGKHTLVIGDVKTLEPPTHFAHTLRFTQYDDPACLVSYELKAVGKGVEVTMRLQGMPSNTPTSKGMRPGAPMILSRLKDICETGKPSFGTRLQYWLFGHMEFVLPKRTASEHWPMNKR